jgi:HD-GYP domain-containing protein (c-di-GMP phosphodiesterase class II)
MAGPGQQSLWNGGMSQHKRALFFLAVAQLLCLACGLWIQDRFVVAAARWQSKPATADEAGSVEPPLTAEALLGAMLGARILALIWIGGLQVVATYLVLTRVRNEASKSQQRSEIELMRSEKDLVRTRNAVIFGLAKLAEYRDRETGQHLERIALYSTRLAVALRRDPRFRDRITPSFVKTIGISSVLHDIGKVAIEDSVLRKPGRLEPHERARMQQHTVAGSECIRQIELRLGNSNFLQMARQIAMCHHERWDGSGYPGTIAGEDIPLAARVVAVTDIYDALSSKRVYKEAYPHERCVEIIRNEAGKHLDPGMVEVFLGIEREFRDIGSRFSDAENENGEDDFVAGLSTRRRQTSAEDKLLNTVLELGGESSADALVSST